MTFTEIIGCTKPVVQAPVGGVASPRLAAAVANAGGLGSLALTWHDVQGVHAAIRKTRALCRGAIQANFVLDFAIDRLLDAALTEGVDAVSFFWGDARRQIARAKQAGVPTIVVVGSVDEALRAADGGADAIVAQGVEAGGHVRGEVPLLQLLPAIVAAGDGLPVLAAGGIVTADDAMTAKRAGAAGVWVGTRFVASVEANAHPLYQAAIVAAGQDDTILSHLFDGGWPDAKMRTLVNSTLRDWVAAGRPPPGQRPSEGTVIGLMGSRPVPLYDNDAPTAAAVGDVEAMAMYAGTGAARITGVPRAADIVSELARPWGSPGDRREI